MNKPKLLNRLLLQVNTSPTAALFRLGRDRLAGFAGEASKLDAECKTLHFMSKNCNIGTEDETPILQDIA